LFSNEPLPYSGIATYFIVPYESEIPENSSVTLYIEADFVFWASYGNKYCTNSSIYYFNNNLVILPNVTLEYNMPIYLNQTRYDDYTYPILIYATPSPTPAPTPAPTPPPTPGPIPLTDKWWFWLMVMFYFICIIRLGFWNTSRSNDILISRSCNGIFFMLETQVPIRKVARYTILINLLMKIY